MDRILKFALHDFYFSGLKDTHFKDKGLINGHPIAEGLRIICCLENN